MFVFLLCSFLLLNEGHSLSKEEKSDNPIEFWDRLLICKSNFYLTVTIKIFAERIFCVNFIEHILIIKTLLNIIWLDLNQKKDLHLYYLCQRKIQT